MNERMASVRRYPILALWGGVAAAAAVTAYLVFWRADAMVLGLRSYAWYWAAALLGACAVGFALLVFSFSRLHYRFARSTLIIQNGVMQIRLPLETVRLLKEAQFRSLQAFPVDTRLSFWSHFPGSKTRLALQLKETVLWISPQDPAAFRALFYRMVKAGERQLSLSDPVTLNASLSTDLEVRHPLSQFRVLSENKVLFWLLVSAGVAWVLFGAYVMWAMEVLPTYTVLKYSITEGIQWQGDRRNLVWTWVLLLLAGALLSTMALTLYRRERFVAYLALYAFFFLMIMAGVYVFSIIQFVGQFTL
jgi:hypothetical protein